MSDLERDAQNKEYLADELDRVYLRHMMHQYMQNYGDRLLDEESKLPDTSESHPSASQLRRLKRGLRREAKKSNPKNSAQICPSGRSYDRTSHCFSDYGRRV